MNSEWLIGFIEGEGSFIVRNHRNNIPIFSLGQNEKEILEKIREFLGFGIVTTPQNPLRLGWKPYWQFQVNKTEDLMKLIEIVDGKLQTEKKQIQFANWKPFVVNRHNEGRKRDRWSSEDDRMGKELALQKHTYQAIGSVLHRTAASVNHRNSRVWRIPKYSSMRI